MHAEASPSEHTEVSSEYILEEWRQIQGDFSRIWLAASRICPISGGWGEGRALLAQDLPASGRDRLDPAGPKIGRARPFEVPEKSAS